jgi:outer membrane protein OmpA-like peptidoglycan-associated protein
MLIRRNACFWLMLIFSLFLHSGCASSCSSGCSGNTDDAWNQIKLANNPCPTVAHCTPCTLMGCYGTRPQPYETSICTTCSEQQATRACCSDNKNCSANNNSGGCSSCSAYTPSSQNSINAFHNLSNYLQAHDVQVYGVGDNITLVLPSDRFFQQGTSVLNPYNYGVLNKIAAYLRCLEKMDVKVAGYTDNQAPSCHNLALSRQQAQAIANYLWARCTNARVLYAVGYGECMPVASNDTYAGKAENRRIEISFRKITDYYDQ